MHFYTCSAGNPEGTDFSFFLCNEQEYSRDAFQDLCETLIVETLEEQYQKDKHAAICYMDTENLYLKFKNRGFETVKETASYYIEPYWGRESIKSEALLKWCTGKDDEEEAELKKLEEEKKNGQV